MNPPGHELHVQTVPTPSSTTLPPPDKDLDSESQPTTHKKGENIVANVVLHLLTGKDLDATGPSLNTVNQAEGLAAPGINGSSLKSETQSVKTLIVTVASAASTISAVHSLPSDSVHAAQDEQANNCTMIIDSAADVVQSKNPHGEEMIVDESQESILDEDVESELSDGEDIRVSLTQHRTSTF